MTYDEARATYDKALADLIGCDWNATGVDPLLALEMLRVDLVHQVRRRISAAESALIGQEAGR